MFVNMRQPHVIVSDEETLSSGSANQQVGECQGRGFRVALWKIVRGYTETNTRSEIDNSGYGAETGTERARTAQQRVVSERGRGRETFGERA